MFERAFNFNIEFFTTMFRFPIPHQSGSANVYAQYAPAATRHGSMKVSLLVEILIANLNFQPKFRAKNKQL